MTLLLIERTPRDTWDLQYEGHTTFIDVLFECGNGSFRITRYDLSKMVMVPGCDVAGALQDLWPEVTAFEVVKKDGKRRPLKS